MTYQAYNGWPGVAYLGGTDAYSLYNVTTSLDSKGRNLPVPRVSFNRPYGGPPLGDAFYIPPMSYSNQFAGMESARAISSTMARQRQWNIGMVRCLEREGYDVTYITDVDTHEDVDRVKGRCKGFLSVGHDEYWSEEMQGERYSGARRRRQPRVLRRQLHLLGGRAASRFKRGAESHHLASAQDWDCRGH